MFSNTGSPANENANENARKPLSYKGVLPLFSLFSFLRVLRERKKFQKNFSQSVPSIRE